MCHRDKGSSKSNNSNYLFHGWCHNAMIAQQFQAVVVGHVSFCLGYFCHSPPRIFFFTLVYECECLSQLPFNKLTADPGCSMFLDQATVPHDHFQDEQCLIGQKLFTNQKWHKECFCLFKVLTNSRNAIAIIVKTCRRSFLRETVEWRQQTGC